MKSQEHETFNTTCVHLCMSFLSDTIVSFLDWYKLANEKWKKSNKQIWNLQNTFKKDFKKLWFKFLETKKQVKNKKIKSNFKFLKEYFYRIVIKLFRDEKFGQCQY